MLDFEKNIRARLEAEMNAWMDRLVSEIFSWVEDLLDDLWYWVWLRWRN